jgi:nucleotide-binding universal stress UspA family protein
MEEIKNVLFPTDCSERSKNVLHYAIEVAHKFNAKITLLHVIGDITLYGGSTDYLSPMNYEHMIDDYETYSKKHLEEFWESAKDPGVEVELVQVVGDPFKEIIQFAKDKKMDLIVISTHGRTGLQHIMLGSVAEKVVRYSPIPVMTVRDKAHTYKPL